MQICIVIGLVFISEFYLVGVSFTWFVTRVRVLLKLVLVEIALLTVTLPCVFNQRCPGRRSLYVEIALLTVT